ncbi:MAG: hypothetical protein HC851_16145 [Acaryochloris sp. RU_4_1]|nr:hypothetical protein [Acaryochloris sp. SU_5_25]NJM67083.1 hypothetical protein [Acaryochloris sp. RU_4_1]NJN38083.1 hypothetical protein [Acaryochloridaceae cyanobacterium CSU_3_4]NJR54728.1 hypothetical protein [Acaryochloris sp. CRU_2_0]
MTEPPDSSSDPSLSYALSQLTYLEQVRLIMTHPFLQVNVQTVKSSSTLQNE